MADENCCFDDDELRLDELFGGNLFNELLTDAADSVCEPGTENYDNTNRPGNQYNAELDDGDISTFIQENRNKNTVKKTRGDVNHFQRWAKTVNETRTIDKIPPTELNNLLAHFVVKIRKQNGEEFEPDTLTSFFRSFDRFLREQEKQYSLLNDIQFAKAREALASKRKQLRRSGKGQKPNKALGLTTTQIQQLWDEKQLGDHSPKSLLRTVWFLNTIHFGWRARDEHHRANLGDFEIKKENHPDGKEYVEWVIERGSKTRSGEQEFVPDRAFNPKMFSTGGQRCPVNIFKKYLSRRPYEMRSPHHPFYLAAIQSPVTGIWFKKQPLGKNSLGLFMKNMSTAAGITGRHTNHSVRRTMISTLRHENTEPLNIIGLAGQRNLKSLDSYSEASEQQQKEMSLTLSKHVLGKEAPVSARKVLQPLPAFSGHSEEASMFSGATFTNCSFTFGSERELEENPKKRFKRVLSFDSSDEEL